MNNTPAIESHQLAFDFMNHQINWELVGELAKGNELSEDQAAEALVILKDLWSFHGKMDELFQD